MKEIKNKNKISLTTIFSVVFLFIILIVSLTINGNNKSQTNTVNSYLSSNGNATGTINVAGVQLKVYQKTNDSSEYVDVTDTGFDLYYPYFVTDKKYNYDLIIKNDETAEVTADQYYLRWNFTAIIDNQEYDITDYCKVDSAYVYKQEDTDGKTRFYSVNGSNSNTISAQNQLAFLSSIKFEGIYDSLTHKYGSILDNEFSGSKIKIIANIEGSLTPYEIILPTIKFYNTDGSIMQETTVKDIGLVSIPTETPTNSFTVDGETLYFQGWIKNGVAGVVYTPNEEVEVNQSDVFTPYYAQDPDYSTTFAYTQDPVTGEFTISGVNKNVTDITIPALIQGEPVTIVNNRAFYSYIKLQTVTMPQTITKIGDHAFYNCKNLTSINIPESVTTIGDYSFRYCYKLESITLPNALTKIGEYAFYNCKNLTSINIPESVTSIGNSAFYNCTSLTSINIPESVTIIGNNAFFGCNSLTSIDVDSNNTAYCSIDEVLYNKAKTTLIQYPAGKTGASYNVLDGVTNINYGAFYYCGNLTSITIPDSVTSIGHEAFSSCTSLTSITIPNSVTSIGYEAFSSCKSLTSITIPDSVTSIGTYAFYYCTSLESVTLSNTLTTIGESAFRYCTSLISITIPDSVTKIGSYVFYGCGALTSVEFENTTGWYVTTSSSYTGGTSIDVTNASTNATNFKNGSGIWYNKYLYRE